ncbi:hypothetical protein K0M31_012260 [Melipona bicolor]|uniref:Uncharacterized protein n=1 Tax=Melipona bicolor TaxID=60889 RepID=A0AA40KHP0_9HYME|nr:hypothetical protein K0M31_012260 [Melipona bicolor]
MNFHSCLVALREIPHQEDGSSSGYRRTYTPTRDRWSSVPQKKFQSGGFDAVKSELAFGDLLTHLCASRSSRKLSRSSDRAADRRPQTFLHGARSLSNNSELVIGHLGQSVTRILEKTTVAGKKNTPEIIPYDFFNEYALIIINFNSKIKDANQNRTIAIPRYQDLPIHFLCGEPRRNEMRKRSQTN